MVHEIGHCGAACPDIGFGLPGNSLDFLDHIGSRGNLDTRDTMSQGGEGIAWGIAAIKNTGNCEFWKFTMDDLNDVAKPGRAEGSRGGFGAPEFKCYGGAFYLHGGPACRPSVINAMYDHPLNLETRSCCFGLRCHGPSVPRLGNEDERG